MREKQEKYKTSTYTIHSPLSDRYGEWDVVVA
jgi:hypothetical protein